MSKVICTRDGYQEVVYTLSQIRKKYGTCDQNELCELLYGSQGPNVRVDVYTDCDSVTIVTSW